MKKFYYLAIAAIVSVVLTSCGGTTSTNNEPTFSLSNLQGLWLENGDSLVGHCVRFTNSQADEDEYWWGCEWTESEDVSESDLEFHGNGWFKYRLKSDELLEVHMMDQGWADIPKVYIVSALSKTSLSYYEKDRTSNKFKFEKIAELE